MRSNRSPKNSHTSETYSGGCLGSRRTLQVNYVVLKSPKRPFLFAMRQS